LIALQETAVRLSAQWLLLQLRHYAAWSAELAGISTLLLLIMMLFCVAVMAMFAAVAVSNRCNATAAHLSD
jgi:hypothetical protein